MKTRMTKKLFCFLLTAVLISFLLPTAGFAAGVEKKSVSGFYMDTIITLTAYVDDEDVLNDALRECGRYDNLLGKYGQDAPSIGFSIILDDLMAALYRQDIKVPEEKKAEVIEFTSETFASSLSKCIELRAAGKDVVLVNMEES